MPSAISAVVFASAMLWPTLAHAEGWVLWRRTIIISEVDQSGKEVRGIQSPTWEPMDGFENLAECRAKGVEATKRVDDATQKAKKEKPSLEP